jgi:hypothetical protein
VGEQSTLHFDPNDLDRCGCEMNSQLTKRRYTEHGQKLFGAPLRSTPMRGQTKRRYTEHGQKLSFFNTKDQKVKEDQPSQTIAALILCVTMLMSGRF